MKNKTETLATLIQETAKAKKIFDAIFEEMDMEAVFSGPRDEKSNKIAHKKIDEFIDKLEKSLDKHSAL